MRNSHRLCGGSTFRTRIHYIINGNAPKVVYLSDASRFLLKNINENEDALDLMLKEYHDKYSNKTISHTGYLFLEKPTYKENSRMIDMPHAWVEPAFSLIKQTSMSNDCWWTSCIIDNGIYWKGVNTGL